MLGTDETGVEAVATLRKQDSNMYVGYITG